MTWGECRDWGRCLHLLAKPAFPHRWQAAARALMMVVGRAVEANGGEFRHSIERMEPGHYLTSDYYEHWLTGRPPCCRPWPGDPARPGRASRGGSRSAARC